jgi:hypothetical protein
VDEWLTVEWYTWVGVTEAGEHRPVRRMEDFEALPAPSLRNLAIGFYCALGRWPEPNNHVVHSALVNLALAGRRTVAMTRVPALVGAMIFGLVMFVVCWSTVGWHAAAFPVLVLALGWPYTVSFAMNARGYTWALALQALWLLLALKALRQPRSIATGATMAAFAVCELRQRRQQRDHVGRAGLHRSLDGEAGAGRARSQCLADEFENPNAGNRRSGQPVCSRPAAGSLFFVPAVRHTIRVNCAGVVADCARSALTFFPSLAWMVLGTLAVVGIAAGGNHSIGRIVAYMAAVIAIVDCLYILLSARFQYPRVIVPRHTHRLAWCRSCDRGGCGQNGPAACAYGLARQQRGSHCCLRRSRSPQQAGRPTSNGNSSRGSPREHDLAVCSRIRYSAAASTSWRAGT